MPESIKSLEFVYDWVKNLYEKRKDVNFEDSMKKPLFEGEQTAIDVFMHSISILYWGSKKLTNPEADNKDISISLDPESKEPLHDQLLGLFKKAIDAYTEARNLFKEDDLKNKFKSPFGREMTYEDWFGFNIHHCIGHMYQSLRLQAIYLRQKI